KKSALCRSEDSGKTWTIVNDAPGVSPRPFYYSDIRVHPSQENTLYRLAGSLDVSRDGGRTFKRLMPFFAVHGDFHELWIHPEQPDFMIVGGDGGIALSRDGGGSWNFVQNLPVGQFYHVSVDLENPYNVYGGMQDNGSWRGPSRVLKGMGIFNFHWQPVGWGDGFGTVPLPRDANLGYSMSQGGYLVRFHTQTGELKDIRPPAPPGVRLRFNWNAAIAIDPLDPGTLYYGSQFLHKSTDEGQTWQIISPDLTTNNPEKQKQAESGGLTRDVTHAENHCTILTIAPSPVQKGIIWVGTDDGKVQLTQDGGRTWKDLSAALSGRGGQGVPSGTWCPHIEASNHDAATAYVVFDDHRRSNWTPYVFMTEDFGASWKNLATDEIDGFVHVIREDPVQRNLLFLGTEFGLYVSFDRGFSWMRWTNGFPTVPVRDMVIHPLDNDLVIGTHGRSLYILDDIQPLRELSREVAAKPLHLFSVTDAYEFRTSFFSYGYLTPGNAEFQGQNRPYGALISYWVGGKNTPGSRQAKTPEKRKSPKQKKSAEENREEKKPEMLDIEILNSRGEIVRTLKGPVTPGFNRVSWDLKHEPFESLTDPYEGFFPPSGPFVLPGTYTVRIKRGELMVKESFRVLADPRDPVPMSSRRAKHDLIFENGRLIEAVTTAYRNIEKALEAVGEVQKRIDRLGEKHRENIRAASEIIVKTLDAFAHRLTPPKDRSGIFAEEELSVRLAGLGARLESSFDAPTAGQVQEYRELKTAVEQELEKINTFFREAFPEFIHEVRKAGFTIFPQFEPIVIKK
ncbi:MAG: WD40/YVTN/BNR-like repeat-containing protein, partial [Candidatus Aminicenantales bacterium]